MSKYRVTHHVDSEPPVDIKTKAMFKFKGLMLQQNFSFDVNGRF